MSTLNHQVYEQINLGMNIDEDYILKALSECLSDQMPIHQSTELISVLQQHTMFDIFTEDSTQPLVQFRLLGIVEFGITIDQAENEYRINLNQMNLDLARAINMGKTHHIAIPIQYTDSILCIAIAVDEDFKKVIPGLVESAERLKSNYFMGVKACKCGW